MLVSQTNPSKAYGLVVARTDTLKVLRIDESLITFDRILCFRSLSRTQMKFLQQQQKLPKLSWWHFHWGTAWSREIVLFLFLCLQLGKMYRIN